MCIQGLNENTKNSSTLLLKNIQRSHSGNIKCVAKNSTEEDEHEIRLAVVAPPARCNSPIKVYKVTPSGCQLIWKKPNDDEGSPLFKTFFLLEGNQLKMPFHNNDLCGMVQALQLEEHDYPTYIPVSLSSIHLGVRVVNFTAQVEVIIASGIIASGPKKLTSLLMRRLKHV